MTAASLAAAFDASTDINPMVRDIAAPEGDCTTELDGVSAIAAKIEMAGDHAGCWQHVHPHTLDVRDFSYWSANHPGNRVAEKYGRRNPITRWAELDSAAIVFPYHHLIQQWSGKEALFPLVGRLGTQLTSLPFQPAFRQAPWQHCLVLPPTALREVWRRAAHRVRSPMTLSLATTLKCT